MFFSSVTLWCAMTRKQRLQVVLAKIQQSLPEMKRDGSNVLSSLWATLFYAENSTSRSGGVLPQAEFIPKLAKALQDAPNEVIADFEEIRRSCMAWPSFLTIVSIIKLHLFTVTEPSGIRFSVTGNVLGIKQPRSIWAKYFASSIPVSS